MLYVFILSVAAIKSILLNAILLNAILLNAILLNAILLNVVVPFALVHKFQMAVKSFITLALAIFGKKIILRQKVL
jgi:hypothetical protein